MAWSLVVIIEHGPDGGRVEIVELSSLCSDNESRDAQSGEQDSGWDHDEDHRHQPPPFRFQGLVASATTLSELSGMMTAAIRALMSPIIASVAATLL